MLSGVSETPDGEAFSVLMTRQGKQGRSPCRHLTSWGTILRRVKQSPIGKGEQPISYIKAYHKLGWVGTSVVNEGTRRLNWA